MSWRSNLYVELETDAGKFAESVLGYSSGDNRVVNNLPSWAYHRRLTAPVGARIAAGKEGTRYTVRLYADAEHLTPVNLTRRTANHWQPRLRGLPRPPVAATETTAGLVELATTAEANAGTAGKVPDAAKVKAVVDKSVPVAATEAQAGLVQLATTAEANAGTAGKVPDAAKVKSYVDSQARQVLGTELLDHEFPGLTLATTMANQRPAAPRGLTPPFILTAEGNSRGEFHCALTLTLAPVSDVNMAFVKTVNATPEQRTVNLSNILFASDLAAEDAFVFSSTAALNGLVAFSVPVYSNQTDIGTYHFLLVRNAANHLQTYHYWEGKAGGTGATLTAEARITFTPTDAPTASAMPSTPTPAGLVYEDVNGGYRRLGTELVVHLQNDTMAKMNAADVKFWVFEFTYRNKRIPLFIVEPIKDNTTQISMNFPLPRWVTRTGASDSTITDWVVSDIMEFILIPITNRIVTYRGNLTIIGGDGFSRAVQGNLSYRVGVLK